MTRWSPWTATTAIAVALLLGACGDGDVENAESAASIDPSPTVEAPAADGISAAGSTPQSLQRPAVLFSDDSPFNRRIPPNPSLAPNSDAMVRGIIDQVEQQGIVLAIRESAIAVYEVDNSTPRYDVPLTIGWGSASVLSGVPIPPYARADSNNDHEIVFFDRSSGCEWDFWQFRLVGESWVASWGNSTRLDGDGILEQGGAARAGGSALLAGLIWPEELALGQIDHALVFSYGLTKAGGPVAPAVGTDGWSTAPEAIPEGALVQLDPAFDVNSLEHDFERTIAMAMQEYGMYLMDSTSYGIGLYAVNPVGFVDEPYEALVPPSAWEDDLWVSLQIPPEAFRVLAHGPEDPDPPTDAVAADGCGRFDGGWRQGIWQTAVRDGVLYAAAGDRGFTILDVSDPANPSLLGMIDAFDNDLEPVISVAVQDNVAYLGTAGAGIQAVDVSNPAEPRLLDSYGSDDGFIVASISIEGDRLYAVGDELLHILDVGGERMQPLALFEDEETLSNAREISVNGSRAFIADQWYEIVALDIGDPTDPRPLGNWEAEAEGLTQTYGDGVEAEGGFVYYTDEDGGLQVLDVSDPVRPRLVGALDLDDFAYGLDVVGGFAYVANGASGLQIVDVSDPSRPVVESRVPITGYARDVAVDGSHAFVAARDGGIVIVNVTDPAHPSIVAIHPG